jgi:aminoglycoside/choline kinase family phosphotransferase
MQISAGSKGGWRTIQISDADPDQRAALEHLGFPPDLTERYPPGARYFDHAVANLRQALEEMVRRQITGTPASWAPLLGVQSGQ